MEDHGKDLLKEPNLAPTQDKLKKLLEKYGSNVLYKTNRFLSIINKPPANKLSENMPVVLTTTIQEETKEVNKLLKDGHRGSKEAINIPITFSHWEKLSSK